MRGGDRVRPSDERAHGSFRRHPDLGLPVWVVTRNDRSSLISDELCSDLTWMPTSRPGARPQG